MNSKFGVAIAVIVGAGLVYYVSHARIVLHGSTLIWGLAGVGALIWAASHFYKK
ncbi:hypothetical protein HOU02_gp422 [Caulobacter phage CcrBL9]|uniref:Uncharacterized protein n=1 Tax=Caulobacter phage CcrBL9 TaxID=2283270 RepID=A0A385EBZ5_9CAUD|nr:hypothetical protein HOU02_gp422 [Caulobacter phage CcrBL9]AXQ69303.1 hypothetical protein CcrBL9_gp279c [Caulobacter phage CcrBL9]